MAAIKICPITKKQMKPVFSEKILGKYHITYYYSEESGILQTEKPFWLDESYQSAISDMDTGLVSRNIYNQKKLEPILYLLCKKYEKFLDIGGGYGLLARLMRDIGFGFYTFDKYCTNIFAKTFEPEEGVAFEALVAFEVLEHIENPIEFLENNFNRYSTKTIIFSTLTFGDDIPARDWWYFSFESGQHISFYQPRTLELIAEYLGCMYYMIDQELHIITDRKIEKIDEIILTNKNLFRIYSAYIRHKRRNFSKTWEDHLSMKKRVTKI